jgi:UDP-N-acetylmuramate--alanine ligase
LPLDLSWTFRFEKIAEGLHSFTGAGRRFQAKAKRAACWWSTTTDIIRRRSGQRWRRQSLVRAAGASSFCFNRTATRRTHDLMQEFARSFNNADTLFITDIYAASEDPIEGVTAEASDRGDQTFRSQGRSNYIGALENAAEALRDTCSPATSC